MDQHGYNSKTTLSVKLWKIMDNALYILKFEPKVMVKPQIDRSTYRYIHV